MSKNLSQQVVLDRRGFVAATFATVAGLGLAGCSDTSAEADKGSAAGSSKSSEDAEASTTLDAKAFDKLVDNGPKADDTAIAASTWATDVKNAGVFKIGSVQTSTLFSLLNEKDGKTRGFDAGIAQLLSNYILGENKVEITQVTSDTRESVLQNGQVDAVFTPTDNVVMAAAAAVSETLTNAGIPFYTGADSFVTAGAFATCGVNYTELGTYTADMALDILETGTVPEYHVMDGGIITVNTETAAALDLDYSAFNDLAGTVVEVETTAE